MEQPEKTANTVLALLDEMAASGPATTQKAFQSS
jgi:hypothetical protein